MRLIALIAIALFATGCSVGCSATNDSKLDASKLDPKQNLVCIRVAIADPKATCEPELTDVGEFHTHRARVTQGKNTMACSLNDRQVKAACDGLFPAAKQEPEPGPTAAPAEKADTK